MNELLKITLVLMNNGDVEWNLAKNTDNDVVNPAALDQLALGMLDIAKDAILGARRARR